MDLKPSPSAGKARGPGLYLMLALLVAVISLLLGGAYFPGKTLFSNDGPLGRLVSECHQLPSAFNGVWEDLNTIGYREQGALPDVSGGLRLLLQPVLFSKFYAPVALVILGLGAWCCFRQLGLAPPACILGGLAAALNTDFFSNACWGVSSHPLTVGMIFFALAALVRTASWRAWLRVPLAGFAVGLGLAEGADVGAIFSLYVGAFVLWQAWIEEGARAKNMALGFTKLVVVAGFAAFLAAQAISALVSTQIEGVAGMDQNTQTREERWDWATAWSLPKREALGLVMPGLFGYRMDTQGGGCYWGDVGRSPEWERYWASGGLGPPPKGVLRQRGSGIYAGVPVVMLALWAVAQSLRKKDSVFNRRQRQWLWFWGVVAVVSLLLGFGRFAPFYRLVYALPYFSTIRNPVKFLDVVDFALVVLFAYGADGLWRGCLERAGTAAPRAWPGFAGWWERAPKFDKTWVGWCAVVLGAALFGWLVYGAASASLERHLEQVHFRDTLARSIAAFSIRQVGWFVFFFLLACWVMLLLLSGRLAGPRAGWGMALLGLVLVIDLGCEDLPWVVLWDYPEKYASNPVIDLLRDKPWEHRVAIVPLRGGGSGYLPLTELYKYEWAQQHFQYYDIQSLDIVQMPRMPEDLLTFSRTLHFDGSLNSVYRLARRWQLTNTKYLIGPADVLEALNQEMDPAQHRFSVAARFNIVPKEGAPDAPRFEKLTAVLAADGQYAIFQFNAALPRARLYANWVSHPNTEDVLQNLADPALDPLQTVLVTGDLPASAASDTNQNPGTVEITSYASKDVSLKAVATRPAVLLLNDRFDPHWQVAVDGHPATMLRCNYIMRGVQLGPGSHTVEFHFQTPLTPLYVSLLAVGVGVLLLGVVLVVECRADVPVSKTASAPTPTPTPAPRPQKQASAPKPQQRGNGKGKRLAGKSKG